MIEQMKNYTRYLCFKKSYEKDVIPYYLFWIAVGILYLVANTPRNRILIVINYLLTKLPNNWESPTELVTEYNVDSLGELIVKFGVIPLKELLFLIAFLVVFYPILRAIQREKPFLYEPGFKKRVLASLGIFLLLCLLIFPYRTPLGTGSMGAVYAINSLEPFSQDAGWYYRRLLMPAIAHFIHMDGPIPYYLLSIFFTYILIFMSLSFVESKVLRSDYVGESITKRHSLENYKMRFICYLSIATSSYIMHNFQFPGYTEQLFFILLLLAASMPMTRQERLAILALSIATHESSIFVFLPIILVSFPRGEIGKSLCILFLYIFMWLAGSGFGFNKLIDSHVVLTNKSNLQYWIENPGLGLAGWFFSYKLLWIIILYLGWWLWQHGERTLAVVITTMILFPAITSLLVVDISRMLGMSFFGVLICFSILIKEYNKFPVKNILFIIVIANLLCPSYYVGLNTGFQSYPGLYQLIRIFPAHYVN